MTLVDIADLQLEPLAFKVKVPTLEPTISVRFTNISTSAIASSVFSSSFRWVLKASFKSGAFVIGFLQVFLIPDIRPYFISISAFAAWITDTSPVFFSFFFFPSPYTTGTG